MRNGTVWVGAGALAAAAILLAGCEDSGITAPTDGSIVITANPSTVTIDPNTTGPTDPETGERIAQSTIVARVFSKDGAPVQNVDVIFSTTGGKLGTAGSPGQAVTPVKTDGSGIAQDILTVRATDPDSIEVSATSSALTQKVTVKKTLVGDNKIPTANINTVPTCVPPAICSQLEGSEVVFDGSQSLDQDGTIVHYRWEISSDDPAPGQPDPDIVEGATALGLTRTYDQPQNLTVTLTVTDDQGATDFDVIPFTITCDNPAPVADGGQDLSRSIPATSSFVVVTLSAVNSTDELPNGIDRYVWTCGNGIAPSAGAAPYEANCRYDAPGVYTARVTVYDKGSTGQIDPDLGTYPCQKQDDDDVIVTVTKLTQ